MAVQKRIDDPIRLKILEALYRPRALSPNIRQIQKYTKLHKATIKSSIDFMIEEGALKGFGPKFNFAKFGYKLEPIILYQMNMHEKKVFKDLLTKINEDPHVFRVTGLMGSGTWNIVARSMYKDVQDFYRDTQKYHEEVEGMYDLIKNTMLFFDTEPVYKEHPRGKSMLELLKREQGLD